jgi:hypothetical protein
MIFDQVHLISRHVQPIPLAQVIQVEKALGIQLPEGYRRFITRWGLGVYCDLFWIYAPDQIMQSYHKYRKAWKNFSHFDVQGKRHWLYEGSEGILDESQLQESIVIGDSSDGDKLVFFPCQHNKIYILPRNSRTITWIKADFSDLHRWNATAPRVLTFAPWHGQITLYFLSEQYRLNKA